MCGPRVGLMSGVVLVYGSSEFCSSSLPTVFGCARLGKAILLSSI